MAVSVRILDYLGRHATLFLAFGALLGLVFPQLASLARPLLLLGLVIPLVIALVRLDWGAISAYARRPLAVALTVAWLLLISPVLMWLVLKPFNLPQALVQALVLMSAAAPIVSCAALCLITGLDAALAVVVVIASTALMPVSLPWVALALLGLEIDIDLATAYQRALEGDERSAFGGIVACNRPVDSATVERMLSGPQADVVIAPSYESGAIEALIGKRKNTRILSAPAPEPWTIDVRQISGGFLVQDPQHFATGRGDWRVVTKRAPTDAEWCDVELAWRICGHVKSNAIVLVKDGQAVGIGAGQQNRVESGEIAAKKADGRAQGGACASDAFFPFPDGIDAAAVAGAAVIIQPGGAMRDDANIERADELGVSMVFTGERHFLH